MRFKISTATLLVISMLGCFAINASAASDDACALLTQAQVSAAVGVQMGAGTHVTPTYVKTCTWSPTGGSSAAVADVTVSFQDAASFQSAKSLMEMSEARMKATNEKGADQFANQSVSGIGDDAFYTTMGGSYTGLLVKKGDVSFKVAIYGDIPADQKKSMEKAIAQEALSKF